MWREQPLRFGSSAGKHWSLDVHFIIVFYHQIHWFWTHRPWLLSRKYKATPGQRCIVLPAVGLRTTCRAENITLEHSEHQTIRDATVHQRKVCCQPWRDCRMERWLPKACSNGMEETEDQTLDPKIPVFKRVLQPAVAGLSNNTLWEKHLLRAEKKPALMSYEGISHSCCTGRA